MLIGHDPCRAFMPYPAVAVDGAADGPLRSLSFGVKDLFDVAGYRTACGNPVKLAESPIAATTAPAVQALLDAGAMFLGKTHTEELAWSLYGTNAHFGTPLNPAAPDRVPGGSSSGSASAVAGRLCDFALGTDTGGSVRAPASFCGIYGLRPTHGAIPIGRCMPLAPSLDSVGFFARDALTLRQVGEVLLPAQTGPVARLMIAEDLFALLDPRARVALAPMVERIQKILGKAVPTHVYDRPVAAVYEAFRFIQAHEIYAIHGPWIESRRPVLGAPIAERFAFARTVADDQVAASRAVRDSFALHLRMLLADGVAMIAPVVHGPAPRLDDSPAALNAYRHAAMAFLCPAGMAGLPQLVTPAGMVDGAPIGLSLVAAPGCDRALLDLAMKISAAT